MKGNDMVKRYDIDVPDGEFVEKANGRAVLYDDYAAVVAERDALAAVVDAMKRARNDALAAVRAFAAVAADPVVSLAIAEAAALASKGLPTHTARAVLGATDAPADHPMSKLIAEANAAIDAEGGDE